ncbi:MAG: SprT family zinc-dependent metalloprotease [bacterium]
MTKVFRYGKRKYEYSLRIEDRKSLGLTVTPTTQIIVKAPSTASETRIDDFLKRKWVWLEKQVQYFSKKRGASKPKEYVSGESIHYLGRQYKMIVLGDHPERCVKLMHGKLNVCIDCGANQTMLVAATLHGWLTERAHRIFSERLGEMLKLFPGRKRPGLTIRHMKKRWGSYMKSDRIILNRNLIHASKDCIDYVIVHELCHYRHKNHTAAFYRLLNDKYPGWERVKEKLETRYL